MLYNISASIILERYGHTEVRGWEAHPELGLKLIAARWKELYASSLALS